MKISLKTLAVAALLAPLAALASSDLVGTWKTVAGSERALTGVAEFHADGTAKLGPEGFDPLTGTWKETAPGKLTLEMPPHGSTEMTYVIKERGKQLTLTYNTGEHQTFARQPTLKKTGPKK